MALLGGGVGGAGNPVGGSFTGPSNQLEIIGDHLYAYTGQFEATTATQTLLETQSGNFYIVGKILFLGPIQFSNPAVGRIANFTFSMNGNVVATIKSDIQETYYTQAPAIDIIVPPYTELKIEADCNDNDANFLFSAIVTGRIYRTSD